MDKFVKTFLYTYQSFATPDRLLRKLLERYNVVRPEGMSPQGFAVMKQTIFRLVSSMLSNCGWSLVSTSKVSWLLL